MKPAITPIPGKGLQLDLDVFQKLKAFQAGGEFWEHQSQTVIREYLGDFLPLMNPTDDGESVLCQMFVAGKEVAATSRRSSGIPARERTKLLEAIEKLKTKAASPDVDSTTSKIVEAFMLPDPAKDPELYRLYGSRWKPRLMVIWGCEKEEGSSVVPEEASRRVAKESTASGLVRRLPLFLLLLLLLGAGFWISQRSAPNNEGNTPVATLTDPSDLPPAIGPDGKPILGPDGKPLPARPDGQPIAVDSDGNPILDPEGKPLPARPDGKDIALNEDGEPILGPNGETYPAPADDKPLPVDDGGMPIAVDSDGEPILDPDGEPLPARPDGKDIALNEDGEPILGPNGETYPAPADDKPLPVDDDGMPIAVDSDGEPILDPDGEPLPARPDGKDIALDEDGKPILDPEGKPLPARPDGKDIALNEDDEPILGPNGETYPAPENDQPLPVDEEGAPIAVDSEGDPILGPDGKPLPARPDGEDIALNEDDEPILGPNGETYPAPDHDRPLPDPGLSPDQELDPVLVVEGPLDAKDIPSDQEAQRPPPRRADSNEVNLAKLTRPAVVTIAVGDKRDDYVGQGTGFIIASDGLVVTNHHVVDGATVMVAILADGTVLDIENVIASDKARDLAILRLTSAGRKLPFLRLASQGNAIEVGEKIAVMGSPQGLAGTFTTGIVSARRSDESDVDLVQITAPVSPGSSGSPVVNESASVVAIVTGGIDMTKAQALNFAVDVGELHELLAASNAKVKDSVSRSSKEKAANEQDPKDLPPTAAVGAPPNQGGKVDWPKDPSFDKGDEPEKASPHPPIANQDPKGKTPVQSPSVDKSPRIELEELGRESLENGKIKIRLKVTLRTETGTFGKLTDLNGRLDNAPVAFQGNTVVIEATKGTHQLTISGRDDSKKLHVLEASIDVDVSIKSRVHIKVKE